MLSLAQAPPPWIFKCYCRSSNGASGVDVINEWYDSQDEEVQAELDATLEFFANRPHNEWRRPKFDKLGGKVCHGLHEIRVTAASGQYRVSGSFGAERNEFTLFIAFHKQRDSDTNKNCRIAQARKQEVNIDANRARKCPFP
jgi:hypothetical protein